jgi:hypothetical protein
MYRYNRNKESCHIHFLLFLNSIIFGGGVKVKDVKICLEKYFFKNLNESDNNSTISGLSNRSIKKRYPIFSFFDF